MRVFELVSHFLGGGSDMRGVKAKKMRKLARSLSIDMPARELIRRGQYGELVNNPSSTRGVYRALKKGALTKV